jgi:hypothetical protein
MAASVIFHTTDGDKDHDTKLTVRVQDRAGTVLSERHDVVGHWCKKSSYLVSLDIKNALIKEEIADGSIDLRIAPNGRDVWNFDYELWLFFSDGTSFSTKWTRKSLTHDDVATSDSWAKVSSD